MLIRTAQGITRMPFRYEKNLKDNIGWVFIVHKIIAWSSGHLELLHRHLCC